MKKWSIAGLAVVVALGIRAETVTNNLDVQGGFIYNHGAVNPADVGLTFTNAGVRDITVSAGQLSGVDPETGAVITNAANLLPLKAQSLTAASNIVAGGSFIGDGSGLTNLNMSSFSGSISASSLPTSGVWNASGVTVTLQNVIAELSTMTNLTFNSEALATVISNLQQQVNTAYVSDSSVTVQVTDNETTNGLRLIAAYAAATSMNPSASNRIAVIVPPGRYNLGVSGLQMTTPYIDLIGLTSDRAAQYLYGAPGENNGVIKQTADFVHIENLTLQNQSELLNENSSDPAAYFPTVPGSNTVVRNCEFTGNGWSMRLGAEYAGRYEHCVTGNGWSFGGFGAASGTFIDCHGGNGSFGGYGNAEGIFRDCTAGYDSFGSFGTASGTFIDCRSGDYSFGSYGTLATNAVLVNCSADEGSFGSFNTAATNFNYNASGYTFAGGPIRGDGFGLTNLNVSSLNGTISSASLPTSGVWNAAGMTVSNLMITGDGSGLTNLNASSISGVISAASLPTSFVSVASASLVTPVSSSNLVASYLFDGNATDESGNGHDGTVNGATLTSDRFGNPSRAYHFESGQTITADDAGLPSGDAPRTISLWVKVDEPPPASCPGFFRYGSPGYDQINDLGCDVRDGRNNFYFSQYGACFLSQQTIEYGYWHHLAYTYGGDGAHHLYVNGVLSDGESELYGSINTVLSGTLYFGSISGAGVFFKGALDDVFIYNRELSAAEIQQIYRDTVVIEGHLRVKGDVVALGKFAGDGSGLTNLNVSSLSGTINSTSLPTSGVWNASGVTITNANLAGNIAVSSLTVATNLTVQGTISGNGSGLNHVAAGGNTGELQFNENGTLAGNTNFFMHPTEHKLAARSRNGNISRAYNSEIISDNTLIYSVRNEDGTSVFRLRQNGQDTIRLSGDGNAYINGNLQLNGQLIADGSGLTNLPVQAQVNALVATVSNSPAATITTNQIASWNSGGALAGSVQVSTGAVNIATNLTVQGVISGNGAGLTNLPGLESEIEARIFADDNESDQRREADDSERNERIAADRMMVNNYDGVATNLTIQGYLGLRNELDGTNYTAGIKWDSENHRALLFDGIGDLIPLSITVSGAGSEGANGEYFYCEQASGSRPGYLKGDLYSSGYVVMYEPCSEDSYYWEIKEFSFEETNSSSLYTIEYNPDHPAPKLPPKTGWGFDDPGIAPTLGESPAPTISYTYQQYTLATTNDIFAVQSQLDTVIATISNSPAATITTNDIANWNAGNVTNALLTDGTHAMQANLDMGGHSITNISTNSLVYADGQSVEQKYVNVAGDTMTGTLTLQTNLYVYGQTIIGNVADVQVIISNAVPAALIAGGDIISVEGKFEGDGSGLTQLNATNLVGMISTNNLPPEALQPGGGSATNVMWGQISGTPSAQTDLWNVVTGKVDRIELASVATSGDYASLTNTPILAPIATNATYANLTVADGAIDPAKINGLTNTLAGKVDSGALAPVATSGDYNHLTNTPVLAAIATDAAFSNLTVGTGEIDQSRVNGLTDDLAGKLTTSWTNSLGTMAYGATNDYLSAAAAEGFVTKSAGVTNVLSGELEIQGAFKALYVPPRGDLSMGSFTNGLPQ